MTGGAAFPDWAKDGTRGNGRSPWGMTTAKATARTTRRSFDSATDEETVSSFAQDDTCFLFCFFVSSKRISNGKSGTWLGKGVHPTHRGETAMDGAPALSRLGRKEQTTTTARPWLRRGLGREADFSTSLRFGRNDDVVLLRFGRSKKFA